MQRRGRRFLIAGVAVLALAFAIFRLVTGSEVDGVWFVRFEETEGILGLRDGVVYAQCYGDGVTIGTFQVEDGVLNLLVRFRPDIRQPLPYAGTIARKGDGFEMDRGKEKPWIFEPYTGDCSEVRAKLRAGRARRSGDPAQKAPK